MKTSEQMTPFSRAKVSDGRTDQLLLATVLSSPYICHALFTGIEDHK